MSWWRWAAGVAIACGLVGCSVPPPDTQIAATTRGTFDALRHGDEAALQARLGPQLRTPQAQAQFAQVRRYIPAGEPRGAKTVMWNLTAMSGQGDVATVQEEYDYGDRIAVVQTHLSRPKAAATWLVDGLQVRSATTKELAVNDLTLAGKSPLQYAFLALVIAAPASMIWALVKVIRTPGLKRKWLWGVAAFLGLVTSHMIWSSGELTVNWLSVQLLGAGIIRGGSRFSPWVLTMTLPVGALLILTGVWANPARARKPRRVPDAEGSPPA